MFVCKKHSETFLRTRSAVKVNCLSIEQTKKQTNKKKDVVEKTIAYNFHAVTKVYEVQSPQFDVAYCQGLILEEWVSQLLTPTLLHHIYIYIYICA